MGNAIVTDEVRDAFEKAAGVMTALEGAIDRKWYDLAQNNSAYIRQLLEELETKLAEHC